jgi:outer membrane receptor protein involved in Fe transport
MLIFPAYSKLKLPYMRKNCHLIVALLVVNFIAIAGFSQTITVSGTVRNSITKEPIPSVSVLVKGSSSGTFTNENGSFKLTVDKTPVVLVFSSVGYETQEVTASNAGAAVDVDFVPASSLGQEVVVSASRVPERILESPVSIERISNVAIRNSAASNYYDIVQNIKGVDVVAASLSFKTPTTRGFAGSGNTRFNQIVDGMDNQAPGLNFSVGSIIGLTELDVESMELLPGASSVLYGPGGMNGTLLINSKNPFKYQGLSFQVKTGIMHTDGSRGRSVSPYHNWSLRWAQKVSDRFAFKIGSELIQAKDWLADDYRNYKRLGTTGSIVPGTRDNDPNYDGINTYGDETSVNLKDLLNGLAGQIPFWQSHVATLPAQILVSRTGYTENEVVNPNSLNFKLSGALHYKLSNKLEAIIAGHWGTGNTVYTGSQRYSLKDLKVGQYKVELKSDNWFVRAYTTQENSGQSHNLTVTSQLFNEAWKPTVTRVNGVASPQGTDWLVQYAFAYMNAKLAGQSELNSHNIARSVADVGRPAAGSQQFKTIFDRVRKIPIPQGGLFLDRTDLWFVEGQYNLSKAIKVLDVLIGGNWKQYKLNSQGTLFADKIGDPIIINEVGAYIQVGKEIIPDRLKLTAAGRYDKNENFEGRFTPRVTALLKVAKDHNIRLSFQTAYRFPSTQQQWIDLDVGSGRLIGANKFLWDKYDLTNNNGYDPATVPPLGTSPTKIPYKEAKPESVTTFEVGYKSLISKKLLIDAYAYYGNYENFLTRRDVIQFASGVTPSLANPYKGFSVVVNSPEKVETYGWAAGLEWLLPANFTIGASASSDKIENVPAGFRAFFNAPELRTVFSFGNTGFGKQKLLGFNVSWRWQDGFFYENDFNQGDLPAYHNVDASISLKQPKIKSLFKIGANNLLNQYYRTAIGNPSIGGLYYVSFAYNVL